MDFKLKYFSNNGLILHHPNPEADNYQEYPSGSLGERRPVIYRPQTRDVYVGEPGWYHADTYSHYGMDQYEYPPTGGPTHEGFFNGNVEWGNGTLSWYNRPSDEEHKAVQEALLNAGHEIVSEADPEDVQEEEDFDWQ